MTLSRVMRAAALVLAALAAATGAAKADGPDSTRVPMKVALGPGSVLWLEGTSTMHDFESRSKEVAITLERDAAAPDPTRAADLLRLIRAAAVRGVTVRVPVATLRSEKSGLDKNLRRTMEAEKYPEVRFHLGHYTLGPGAAEKDTVAIDAAGSLTITDQERPIQLAARAWAAESGVWLEGSQTLRMSEYGIKPPTMMLGTLRVGDRITVRYRLLLVPEGGASSPAPGGSK
jgi:hypothetical protein